MARFNADKIYFDELVVGIGPQVNMDDGNMFDAEHNTQIAAEIEITLSTQRMILKEILDIDIECEFEVDEDYSSYIDLLQLVPIKFRGSELLQQYLQEVGTLTGTWLGEINDLATLIDKYSVAEDYLQNLADLVNLTIISDDSTSLIDKRRQLIQVIDWYKLKGTYKSLAYIGYLLNMNITLWDLYTNDYSTFIEQPWFAGYENENPGGLDSSYYKSPHIGIQVLLNQVYGTLPNTYLFSSSMYSSLSTYVELSRPINVVPNYSLLLSPETDQTGDVMTVDGNIRSCIIGVWDFTRLYFDMSQIDNVKAGTNEVVDGSSNDVKAFSSSPVYFDDGKYFDFTDDSFYNSITTWKIGTGSKNTAPANTGWAPETIVLTGTVDEVRVYADRVEYEFSLPNDVTISGISELGLYLTSSGALEIGSTFPDIDIVPGITLKVLVTIQI